MDLGAFLEPGVYPVWRLLDNSERLPWGHIHIRRHRQPSWLSQKDHGQDPFLCLAMEVPNHKLDVDGSLCPATGHSAPLFLAGEVATSRIWTDKSLFVLRFKTLIRLLDN
jgi:hypothetical protein